MDKTIEQIPKNATEEIRIDLSHYKGHDLVGLRVWVEPDNGTTKIPTKKGITFRVDLLPTVIEALQKAQGEAKAAGLLDGLEE